jgi:TrmH family RNA methyltransferase
VRRRKAADARVLVDGWHLLIEAQQAGLAIECAAFATDLLQARETALVAEALAASGTEVLAVSPALMQTLSPVRTPSGIVAVARHEAASLARAFAHAPQLVLLAVDVQDPGNLGAMIRAAEAAGATGLVACGASADPFGWKALRGSMGSAFRLPVARAEAEDALAAAAAAGLQILAAVPRVGHPLFETDLRPPTAFVLGGEGAGLALGLLEQTDGSVSIPMRAPVESLNVAVAAALLFYEALRQRSGARGAGHRERRDAD